MAAPYCSLLWDVNCNTSGSLEQLSLSSGCCLPSVWGSSFGWPKVRRCVSFWSVAGGALVPGVHGALFWGLCERTSCLRTFCAEAALEWQ